MSALFIHQGLIEGTIAAANLASGVRPLGCSGLVPVRGRGLAATFHAPSRRSAANESRRGHEEST